MSQSTPHAADRFRKNKEQRKGIPVLFLSTTGSPNELLHGFKPGFKLTVAKLFECKQLLNDSRTPGTFLFTITFPDKERIS
jgi:DNA-binding response OmpR family regulator